MHDLPVGTRPYYCYTFFLSVRRLPASSEIISGMNAGFEWKFYHVFQDSDACTTGHLSEGSKNSEHLGIDKPETARDGSIHAVVDGVVSFVRSVPWIY